MTDTIDRALDRLKAAESVPDLTRLLDLTRLEAAVWSRLDARRMDNQGLGNRAGNFGGFGLQLAVSCGALLLGLAIAHFADSGLMPRTPQSEMVVISDDGAMAPSFLLEGGS